jgi:putative transposase
MPWKEQDVVSLRTEFVRRSIEPGVVFRELCAEYGVSAKTGYKWQRRFLEQGLSGLKDQRRTPQYSPHQLPEPVVCDMVRLKLQHRTWGPQKIRQVYLRSHGQAPSESSFKRVLDKAGLVQRRRTRRAEPGQRLMYPMAAEAPNDVWTVDFKGWWRMSGGRRCDPLTIRDEFSRYVLEIRAMQGTRTAQVREAFEEVFEQHGMPKVIRSDNGQPFASWNAPLGISGLSAWWVALGIRLDRIEPGHPEQNGGHERMHRDIRMELQGVIEGDQKEHQHAFDVWREQFNRERPHQALQLRVPAEVYAPSAMRYQEVDQIEYPTDYIARKVSSEGSIRVGSRPFFITTSLRGWNVGLKYATAHQMEVRFGYMNLGILDLDGEVFIGASPDETRQSKPRVLPMS